MMLNNIERKALCLEMRHRDGANITFPAIPLKINTAKHSVDIFNPKQSFCLFKTLPEMLFESENVTLAVLVYVMITWFQSV